MNNIVGLPGTTPQAPSVDLIAQIDELHTVDVLLQAIVDHDGDDNCGRLAQMALSVLRDAICALDEAGIAGAAS